MAERNIVCTLCPQGCVLTLETEPGHLIKFAGNKCPKGVQYAQDELENPLRTLTTTVLCSGLSVKMLPVKTDRPIPKTKLLEAMEAVKILRLNKPVKVGEVILENLLELGVNLVATREI